jgi:predicted AAA+ superfamily ATPase
VLDAHPARGTSWEAFVIDQLVSAYQRVAPGSQPFFWRTAQGDEVDCLIDLKTRRVPFEIKLHSAPTSADAAGLRRCMRDLEISRGYLLHPGRQAYALGEGVTALPAEPLLAHPERVRRL